MLTKSWTKNLICLLKLYWCVVQSAVRKFILVDKAIKAVSVIDVVSKGLHGTFVGHS